MIRRVENQKALVAIGEHGGIVLHVRGSVLLSEMQGTGPLVDDLFWYDNEKPPKTEGPSYILWLWEGAVVYDIGEEDTDMRLEGTWKPVPFAYLGGAPL